MDDEVFHKDITRTKGTTNVPVVICGNKCDLEEKRVVSKTEGEELAQRLNAKFYETSAMANINIEESFATLVKDMKKQEQPNGKEENASDGKKKKKDKNKNCQVL